MAFTEIIKNFLRPGFALVMLQKIKKRLLEAKNHSQVADSFSWCKQVCEDFDSLANTLNEQLWRESKDFERRLLLRSEEVLKGVDFDLGGGGYYPLLYFLTRHLKPEFVVETGVAAGFSTQAFLSAMTVNDKGVLYSSDFPYFRIKNPEKYIGILVEEKLKARWKLYIKGDIDNLNRIVKQIPRIDLFHYDSDKTYSGRAEAFKIIENLLYEQSILIMDDIQDNLFFHDLIKAKNMAWHVFSFKNKYIGVIGKIA